MVGFARSLSQKVRHEPRPYTRKRDHPLARNGEKKDKAPRRYRDARTGRFVTKKYAKKNRKTTMKESIDRRRAAA